MTNADKLRGMPTEDLAKTIDHAACPPDMKGTPCKEGVKECCACWIRWLNTETEEWDKFLKKEAEHGKA